MTPAGILFSTAQGADLPSGPGRPLNDFWPWFVLAALCVFVAEIAVRQISLPAAWTARWQNAQAARPAASGIRMTSWKPSCTAAPRTTGDAVST